MKITDIRDFIGKKEIENKLVIAERELAIEKAKNVNLMLVVKAQRDIVLTIAQTLHGLANQCEINLKQVSEIIEKLGGA